MDTSKKVKERSLNGIGTHGRNKNRQSIINEGEWRSQKNMSFKNEK